MTFTTQITVQKRTPDRNDSCMNKPVIPASVREEPEESSPNDSTIMERSEKHSTSMQQQHTVNSIKQDNLDDDNRQHQQMQQHGHLGQIGIGGPSQYESQLQHHQEHLKLQQQHNVQQQQISSSLESRGMQQMNLQQQHSQPSSSVEDQRSVVSSLLHHHQHSRMDIRASSSVMSTSESNNSMGGPMLNRHGDEDPYRT
jgi:hypothetical protein